MIVSLWITMKTFWECINMWIYGIYDAFISKSSYDGNPLSEDKSLRTNSVKSFYTANVFRIQNRILEQYVPRLS